MADNVPVTPGSGATVATDDVAGVHYQINKVAFGALDTATLASVTNPLPIQAAGLYLDEAGAALTVKRAFANVAAASTDANIVSAVASKRIRVLFLIAKCAGTATNLTFNSKPAGAGTAISPLFANDVFDGPGLPYNQFGWFQTTAGEGLTVTTGAGSTTGILVGYVEST